MRQPWAEIIPPGSESSDPQQADYLDKVAAELSDVEYTELRKSWLYYQQCQIDVDGLYKKIKLSMRGTRLVNLLLRYNNNVISFSTHREPLRKGAMVLVDTEDKQRYIDLVEGKATPSASTAKMASTSSLAPPPPPCLCYLWFDLCLYTGLDLCLDHDFCLCPSLSCLFFSFGHNSQVVVLLLLRTWICVTAAFLSLVDLCARRDLQCECHHVGSIA